MSASRNQDPRAAGRIHLVIPVVIAMLIFAVALFFLESEQAGPVLPELDELDSLTDLDTVPAAVDASAESTSQTQSVVSEAVDATADHGPTRGIHGLVRNAMTLEPLADAHIELRRLSANWAGGDRGVVTRARSDDDGRFVLEVPGGLTQLSVTARRDGFVANQRVFWSGLDTPVLKPFDLVAGIHITGEVVTVDGNPVNGGEVYSATNLRLERNSGWGTSSTVTSIYTNRQYGPSPAFPVDESGRFSVFLNGDLVALQARIPGYSPAYSEPLHLDAKGNKPVRIVVSGGKTFRGIVRSKSGQPIAGARVTVAAVVRDVAPDRQFQRYLSGGNAVSGADGSFEILDMSDEVTTLMAEHDEYLPFNDRQARLRTEADPYVIELEAAQWIVGRSVSTDGQPLAAGQGWLADGQKHLGQVEFLSDGSFRSIPFAVGPTGGMLNAPGAGDKDLQWEPGAGQHDVGTVEFASGKVITVEVRGSDGEPIAGASVGIGPRRQRGPWSGGGRSVATDIEGRARLAGLGAGATAVVVEHPGYSAHQETVHLAVDEETRSLDVTLREAARVLLTVIDEGGQPLSGVQGAANPKGAQTQNNWWGGMNTSIHSDPQGRMAFSDLDVDTHYTLTLMRIGFPPTTIDVEPLSVGERRDLGATTLVAGTTISGRVTDLGGRGVGDAIVSARPTQNRRGFPGRRQPIAARTSGDGRYTLSGIGDGSFHVTATAEGYIQDPGQSVTVEEGRAVDGILFQLRPGEVYEGVVVHEDGTPVPSVALYIHGKDGGGWKQTRSDSDGHFQFLGAPDGAVTLNVNLWNSGTGNYSEQIEAASVRGLPRKIVIPSGATIEVTVKVTGSREPPESVSYSLSRTDGNRGRRVFMNGQNRIALKGGAGVLEGVQAGSYQFAVFAEGFPPSEPQELELVSGQRQKVKFILDGQTVGVTIRVQDPQGEPIARANVRVSVAGRNPQAGSSMVFAGGGVMNAFPGGGLVTDTEGICVTFDLGSEPATVSVHAAGYAPRTLEDAHTLVAGSGLTVVLDPESAFLVTVTDEIGEPLDGVQVTARRAGAGAGGARNAVVRVAMNRVQLRGRMAGGAGQRTAGGGFARIGGLSADDYDLRFHLSGEELGVVEASIGVGEEQTIDFQLAPALVVRGTITVNGAPAEGGQLRLTKGSSRKEISLGPGGQYEAQLATAGEYVATVRRQGTWLKGQKVDIARSSVVDLDFGAVRIRALVLLPDGSPAVNLRGNLSGNGWISFRTDEEGRFESDLSPGTYTWHFQAPQGTFAPQSTVEIQDDLEVTYQLEAGSSLRIRFVGEHIPASVWVTHVGSSGERSVVRNMKGNPRSEDGVEVSWPLGETIGYVQGNDAARAYFELEPGQEVLEMAMEPGGSLSVRVVDDTNTGIRDVKVELEPLGGVELADDLSEERTSANGNVWMAIPPGEYRVRATLPSGQELEDTVRVTRGQATTTILVAESEAETETETDP